MYCTYCLQSISDHSKRCSECGSQLAEGGDTAVNSSAASVMPAPQTLAIAGAVVIILPLLLCGLISLVRGGSMGGLFGPAAPPPIVSPQVTRTTFATATPLAWQEHTNRQAGFSMTFPANWLVVNQAQAGWQDDVRAEGEQYGWAESLFETRIVPSSPRTRAVDPFVIDIPAAKIAVFNAGLVNDLGDDLTLNAIEQMATSNAPALLALAGPQDNPTFANQRSERQTINGRETLLIEYTSDSEILGQPMRGRVRLYFIQGDGDIYVVSYVAEEQLANANRAIYDQIVGSFQVNR